MARPRKVSDEELMAACGRAIGRHGPGFTLAHVAAEAGVAVGTVSARFGSKHALMVAMMTVGTAQLERRMLAAAAHHDDPTAAIIAAVLVTAEGIDDPDTVTQHLAMLGVDLADPVLRNGFAEMRAVVHRVLRRLLGHADLPGAPGPPTAARIVAALAHGAMQDWALRPTGSLRRRLRDDIGAVLTAWRTRPAASPFPPSSPDRPQRT